MSPSWTPRKHGGPGRDTKEESQLCTFSSDIKYFWWFLLTTDQLRYIFSHFKRSVMLFLHYDWDSYDHYLSRCCVELMRRVVSHQENHYVMSKPKHLELTLNTCFTEFNSYDIDIEYILELYLYFTISYMNGCLFFSRYCTLSLFSLPLFHIIRPAWSINI